MTMATLKLSKPALILVLLAFALAVTSAPARADSITASLVVLVGCTPSGTSACTGASSASGTFGGVLVTITGFTADNVETALSVRVDDIASDGPMSYVGIGSGNENDEIDVDGTTSTETLVLTFDTAVVVDTIDINKLFAETSPFTNDSPDELGQVCSFSNGSLMDCLQFSGTEDGRLTLSSLFDGSPVDELRFIALSSSGFDGSRNSDYGISSIGFTPVQVPEPATLLLLGTGLAALALWRRHRGALR